MSVFSDPTAWGPPAWVFLHCIARTYPLRPSVEEKDHYRVFFTSLAQVLPCKKCRNEYQRYLREHPVDEHLSSRAKLDRWLIALHNNVNLLNNKQARSPREAVSEIRVQCQRYQTLHEQRSRHLQPPPPALPRSARRRRVQSSS